MSAVRRLSPLILGTILLGIVTFLLTLATHGLSPSLIEPDEGGHYVNALFLGDWIRAGLPLSVAYAKDFYAHFPRLTIGHWPPGWYMIEAPFFAIFRPSPLSATIVSSLLAGVPGIAVIWAFRRLGRTTLGVALGLAYALLPVVLDGARYILIDQPLALTVALAAMAWSAAADRPTWPRMLGFALLAAAAPLIKGNGALVALVPVIDIALTGRWRLLRRPPLWGAALLALAIVTPWYLLSFMSTAEGFNYPPGLPYAWLALTANAQTILANIGIGGVILAIIGAGTGMRPSRATDAERRLGRLGLAVVLATLLFQSAIPASLVPRYMAPLLPWLMVLIGLGIVTLARIGSAGVAAAGILAAIALWPAVATLAAMKPKPDIGAPRIAETMARGGGIWLVDGSSGAEGGVIAAAAHRDGGTRRIWVARASQWLSSSDFMGRHYRLTATDPAAARGVLDRLGAAGMVSVAPGGKLAYPHSHMLVGAVSDPAYAVTDRGYSGGDGRIVLAIRRTPTRPNAALLATDGKSATVGKMTGSSK